ncbi:MAG: hypothetical protein K6F21_04965, partial [Bacteroidales bacterium]|nr:hypothetical protein [Bacteroidales bacterium]
PSALLGLKSWSVLRYMEEDGRKHSFKLKGRFYNPATNDSRPLMAVVENHVDGSNSVVLISTDKGSIQEEYSAPAGLQPVEPVWLGEELYASAISEDGFSIYHLPDWKPVFAPAHSKINSLFARDGQIWFTSDRSGVNELHSLDPASGELLQRSNLRFGGEDFAFSQDGSLWYSAPTADARVVRRLAPGALQAKPVEFNPIQIASAEKLSSQEASGALPYDGPISEGKRYSKFFQPIRPHSWVPLYIEYDPVERLSLEETETSGNLGATLMFQNELGTAWGSVGVSLLDSLSFRPGLHAQYVWTGWGPIIDFRADYNERAVHRTDYSKVTTEEGITFPQTNSVLDEPFLSVSAGISLPFNLSGGGWNTGIVPSYRLSWNNDQISSIVAERFTNNLFVGIAQNDFCLLSRFSLRAYSVLPQASSAIMPRVGAGAELGFTLSHNLSSDHPGYYYGKFYGYLPGLMSTHGIKLSASGRSNYGWEGDWIKERLCTLEADYAFPFLPLDWTALCPFFYVRNLEAILHCGAELRAYEETISLKKGSSHEAFAGATLRAHLGNFLWAPYDTYLGVRYIHYFNDPSLSGAEMVFSIDM